MRRVRERYTRNRPRPFAFGPAVAYDARGRRVVAWIEDSYPDPGWEAEVAVGRVIGWSGGRRVSLDSRAGEVQLTGLADGVLSLSDVGSWRSSLVGAARLAGPAGSTYRGRSIAVSPARTVFTWRGRPGRRHPGRLPRVSSSTPRTTVKAWRRPTASPARS